MSREIAIEWLKAANDDLMLIESILDKEELTYLAAFHSQQSVEKSMKAILEFYDKDVPKKHDLLLLKKLIGKLPINEELCAIMENEDILDALNSIYIDARYPGALGLLPNGKPDMKDVRQFYEFANKLWQRVKTLIT